MYSVLSFLRQDRMSSESFPASVFVLRRRRNSAENPGMIIRVNAAVSHDDAADDIIFLKAFPQMLFVIDMTGFDGNLIEMRVTGTKVQM